MLSNKQNLPGGRAAVKVAVRQVDLDLLKAAKWLDASFWCPADWPQKALQPGNMVTIIWYSHNVQKQSELKSGLFFYTTLLKFRPFLSTYMGNFQHVGWNCYFTK